MVSAELDGVTLAGRAASLREGARHYLSRQKTGYIELFKQHGDRVSSICVV